MKRTLTQKEFDTLLEYDKWQCEVCSGKIRMPMRNQNREDKIGKLREHYKTHTFPWRDPNEKESINDFWLFSGETIQKPFIQQ